MEERREFGYEYYRRQMEGKSQHWINVYILGMYGSTFGGRAVYQNDWSDEMIPKEHLEPHPTAPVILGIDTTGLNPAVVAGQMRLGVLHVQKELYSYDVPFEPFVRDILLPFLSEYYPNSPVTAYTDPANPRDSNRGETPVEVLRQYGVTAINAPTNKLKARLDCVKGFLQRRDGLKIDKNCDLLIDGFRGGYCYKPLNVNGSMGETFSSEPTKNDYSHIHDALQYLCAGLRHATGTRKAVNVRRAPSKRVY